jgi:3',5'-cyclic AMP phosphodiesterase CpdA
MAFSHLLLPKHAMTANTITILHLSDMQFGINHRFGAEHTECNSLLQRLHEDLCALEPGLKPDLVVLSGDLTEWANLKEFEDVYQFIDGLSQKCAIPHNRIILIPGNHDINRKKCEIYFENCQLEGDAPKAPYFDKWTFYKRFFDRFYEGEANIQFTEERPYSLFEIAELKVVVAGLNSTLKESHRDTDHYGWVGEEQLKWFKAALEGYKQRGWLRIAAVHHNVQRGAIDDDENLKDAEDLKRLLKDSVNLVLHGHTHQADLAWLTQKSPILATGSAGLKQTARPDGTPNQYQLIQLQAQQLKRYCRAFIVSKKEWGWDNAIHKNPDQPFQIEDITFENINATFAVDSTPAPANKAEPVSQLTGSKKIAILTANPIDKKYDYSEQLKGFKKLKCTVDYFYLSYDVLHDLDGYDYLIILSKLILISKMLQPSEAKPLGEAQRRWRQRSGAWEACRAGTDG